MKDGIHPVYHPVVFLDTGAGFEFVSRSTMKSKEVRKIDGVDHFVIRLDISSASHPFYTGKQRFVDTAGRIERFREKYGSGYGAKKKVEKPAAPPPAAKPAPKAAAPKPPKPPKAPAAEPAAPSAAPETPAKDAT
jgi:large subunit ribosomal protein L31